MPQDFYSNSSSPYANAPPPFIAGPPPKKSKAIWIVLGVFLLGGVGVCGCYGGLVYFGFGVMATEIANELRDDPVLREHIGEIRHIKVNFMASVAEEDDDVYVYEVMGDRGSGTITVKSATNAGGVAEVV